MKHSSLWVIGSVLLLGIGVAMSIGRLAQYPDIVFPLLLILIGITGVIPLIIIWWRPGWDLFEPILLFSVLVFPSLIALYNKYYLLDHSFHYGDIIEFDYGEGMTIVAGLNFLLIFFTVIGYYLHFNWYNKSPKVLLPVNNEQMIRTTRGFAAILMLIGFVCYVIILFKTPLHSNPFYLYQTNVPRSEIFADVNFLVELSLYMYIGLFLWMSTTIANGRVPSIPQLLLLLVITVALVLLGGRGRVVKILVIFSVLIYYVAIKGTIDVQPRYFRLKQDRLHRFVKRISIPIFGFFIVLTVIVLGLLRAERAEGIQDALYTIDLIHILTLGNSDGRGYEYLLILISLVPGEFGYYYGTSYVRSLLNFIPRFLWADKPPLTIGSTLRRVAFPGGSGGRPPGLAGVFYANFGAPGVVIGGLASGILFRACYELLTEHSTAPMVVLLYSIFIAEFVVIGSLTNGAIFSFLWHVIPIVSLLIVHRWVNRPEIS